MWGIVMADSYEFFFLPFELPQHLVYCLGCWKGIINMPNDFPVSDSTLRNNSDRWFKAYHDPYQPTNYAYPNIPQVNVNAYHIPELVP